MPPRKKAAAKAQATPSKATRAVGHATPATVTSKRGTEYETTAAAARPRRESAVPAPLATAAKSTAATAPKKRGRPAKSAAEDSELPKKRGRPSTNESAPAKAAPAASATPKKRGRPAKAKVNNEVTDDDEEDEVGEDAPPPKKRSKPAKLAVEDEELPKKRGRPSAKESASAKAAPTASATPKKRGPPAKAKVNSGAADGDEEDEVGEDAPPPTKRGRSAATKKDAPAVPEAETAPPKKRGRPPKGGETTKIDTDDKAAAEQLVVELQDTAEEPAEGGTTRKRKAPVSQKGKGVKAKARKGNDVDVDVEEDDAAANDKFAETGKNFWLLKAEQEDRVEKLKSGRMFNTKFTIDDLRAKNGPEPWDGVRNNSAASNMRAMKQGDLAFFYASGGKKGRTPGIVGICEIVKEHEPDLTAWNEDAIGYVDEAKANTRDRWSIVHVEFRKKLTKPVSLSELKKYSEKGGALSKMQEFKSGRLSVSRITENEWNFIIDNLVEGYEENEDGNADDGAAMVDPAKAPGILDGNGGATLQEAFPEASNDLSDSIPPIPSTEAPNEPLPTDTFTLDGTSATSRPASRASRQASHQPPAAAAAAAELKANGSGSRAGSRAGSLAPPQVAARGRSLSRTSRAGSAAPVTQMVVAETVMQTVIEEDFAPA